MLRANLFPDLRGGQGGAANLFPGLGGAGSNLFGGLRGDGGSVPNHLTALPGVSRLPSRTGVNAVRSTAGIVASTAVVSRASRTTQSVQASDDADDGFQVFTLPVGGGGVLPFDQLSIGLVAQLAHSQVKLILPTEAADPTAPVTRAVATTQPAAQVATTPADPVNTPQQHNTDQQSTTATSPSAQGNGLAGSNGNLSGSSGQHSGAAGQNGAVQGQGVAPGHGAPAVDPTCLTCTTYAQPTQGAPIAYTQLGGLIVPIPAAPSGGALAVGNGHAVGTVSGVANYGSMVTTAATHTEAGQGLSTASVSPKNKDDISPSSSASTPYTGNASRSPRLNAVLALVLALGLCCVLQPA